MSSLLQRAVMCLLGLCAFAQSAEAQDRPLAVCDLPALDAIGPESLAGTQRARIPCDTPTARFEVDYADFPVAAEEAFAAAVETWSCRVASDVTIRIEASWTELPGSTLGSAGPFLIRNFSGAPSRNTWYAAPLADALAGNDLDAGADIQAEFNSTFGNWHLDPDTEPPANSYDLYTVVLHELAHGLGFIGGLRVEGGIGYVGGDGSPEGAFIYDRFTSDGSGARLLSLPAPSTVLADALRSFVVFDGPASRRAVGEALELHAPKRWEPGGSYSHLAESAFGRGTPDGLMTPFIGRGESIDQPGRAVCALLADLGWTLDGACADAVGPVAPPSVAGLTLLRSGPNPVRRDLELTLSAAVPSSARVTLVDLLGRRIAELYVGTVGPEADAEIRFDARSVASGSYLAVAEADGDRAALPVIIVR